MTIFCTIHHVHIIKSIFRIQEHGLLMQDKMNQVTHPIDEIRPHDAMCCIKHMHIHLDGHYLITSKIHFRELMQLLRIKDLVSPKQLVELCYLHLVCILTFP